MEVILYFQCVYEFPTVNIKQEPREQCGGLQKGSFVTSLECSCVSEPGQGSSNLSCLLNIHMGVHMLKCQLKVQRCKSGLGGAEIFRIIHPVVDLVLVFVQVTNGPSDFVP
jgi:hypothetical protein